NSSKCSSTPPASDQPGASSSTSWRTATSESSEPTGISSASQRNSASALTSPARRSDPPSREGRSPDGATPMHSRFLLVLLPLLPGGRFRLSFPWSKRPGACIFDKFFFQRALTRGGNGACSQRGRESLPPVRPPETFRFHLPTKEPRHDRWTA